MLLDAVDEVFKESPKITAGVTLTVVFVVAGLAFRSLLIPLRLLWTVMVTLLIVRFIKPSADSFQPHSS